MSRPFADLLARLRRGVRDDERARLAAILALNRRLAAAGGLRALLTVLLDEAIALFGAERGFVFTAGEGAATPSPADLQVELARTLDKEPVQRPAHKVSRTILGRAVELGGPVFCADAQEGDFAAARSVADQKLRSVLCTPMLVGERAIGAIYLDHRFQSGAFSDDDLPWLQAFADQAAIAVHLHRLLAQNRLAADELAARKASLEQQVAVQAAELADLQRELSRDTLRGDYADILGDSPALLRYLHLLDRVAGADFPVLIQGESGSGKELAARALWRNGARRDGPLRALNVAAISRDLIESELFGHVRGAFTGADQDRGGLLHEADGGVLFLDEIGELRLDLQAKLLRFLEDGMVRPVGGDREHHVDLRVVAATNRPLRQAVEEGSFREDLYYRLAVVTVDVPSLRERAGDVPLLADALLARAAAAEGREPRRLSPECARALSRRTWPGNVRELRNVVLRMDALAAPEANELGADLLPPEAASPAAAATLDLAELERQAIAEALRRTGGNKAEAARLLGISRRTLYNKLGTGE